VRIENFLVTYIYISIYFSIYIIFFLLLRIYQLGKPLDLKVLYLKYISLFPNYQAMSLFLKVLIILSLIIIMLISRLIFIRIRQVLEHELWKLYFYKKNIWEINGNKSVLSGYSPRYEKISYHTFCQNIFFSYKNNKKIFIIRKSPL
jgi:hypothetical protein